MGHVEICLKFQVLLKSSKDSNQEKVKEIIWLQAIPNHLATIRLFPGQPKAAK